MKKRSTEILQRLLKKPGEALSLQKLTEEYHISDKTLKSDIQEIEEFAKETAGASILCADSQQLFICCPDSEKGRESQWVRTWMDRVYQMDFYQYKMAPEERKFYIVSTLLCHEGYYSMQQLADELYVTRNTIINDCRLVDEYLKKYGIVFVAKNKLGIKIQAQEEQIQALLIGMLQSLLTDLKNEKTFFVQALTKKLGFFHTLREVMFHVNSFAREHNLLFAKETFLEIGLIIFVMVNRLLQLRAKKESPSSQTQLDTIGELVQYVLEELEYGSFGEQEILTIEKQILARRIHPQIQSFNDFELYSVVCHFLLEISREIDVDIQFDNLLIESLISHLKEMSNWNDADYYWDMEYEKNGDFLWIRNIAEEKFQILERYLQYQMTEKMRDSIVIHICAALLRGRKNSRPVTVVISCPGSMATSKYLEAQIKNYFNFHIADTMTVRQVEEESWYLENTDFIISTVPIPNSALPVLVVNPLITVDDIHRIQNLAFQKQKERGTENDTRVRFPVLAKIIAIYESGNSRKIAYLNRELQQILEDSFYVETRVGQEFVLLRMLKLKYMKLVEQELPWREAMKEASADLIRDGYFDESYVKEAIGNVEEYGSYIIVNQGVALAHASRDNGVYADGISLLVSKEGIVFEEGERVYLLFFFSQKEETDYLDLFKEIIRLGKNPAHMEKLRCLSDVREVYRMLWEILSENTEIPME